MTESSTRTERMQYPFHGRYPTTSSYQDHLDREPPSTAPGMDIGAPHRVPVSPVREGLVVESRYTAAGGRSVWIDHKDGFRSYYAHLDVVYRLAGEYVGINTILGLVGQTGRATGPHLHLSITKDGEWIDPATVLQARQAL